MQKPFFLNLVAADVSPRILNPQEVSADSRRRLRFRGSMREILVRGILPMNRSAEHLLGVGADSINAPSGCSALRHHRSSTTRMPIRTACIRWLLPLLLLLPAAGQTQDYTYETNNGTITITGYIGPGGAVTIPGAIDGLPVVSIGNSAFYQGYSLSSVTIPNSVTNIGNSAFSGCYNLTSITIPNNVISIEDYAFQDCDGLTRVTIGSSVVSIGDYAFYFCTSLTNVSIPNSVTNIGQETFANCNGLTSVTIGNSVSSIGRSAFHECENLRTITVDALNSFYSSVSGVLFNRSQTALIQYPRGKVGTYAIPNTVISIELNAFYSCTSLTRVTIGSGVVSIGDYAFYFCTSLTNVSIPNSVTNIGNNAFARCGLTSVSIPNSVITVGSEAFAKCGLTSVMIGNSVTSIGELAFLECYSLTSVTIPDSVTSIGRGAFSLCYGLTSVTIGNNVINIGHGAFSSCTHLVNVVIPNSVTSIGSEAFRFCISLTNVMIGNSVTNIGDYAFFDCTSLTSVTIPNKITSIGRSTFGGCTSLNAIIVDALNAVYSSVDGVLFNKSQTTLIRYPAGKAGIYTIPNNVISLEEYAFANGSLTSVTIPDSVTSLGDGVFFSCTGLTGVYFQGNPPSVGSYVFYGANNAIVYYLPGITDWGSVFADRSTALWNPLAICWQHQDRRLASWQMSGTNFLRASLLRTPPVGWSVFSQGDFNDDGKTDLAFQNTTNGKLAVWFMDGTNFLGSAFFRNGIAPPLAWHAVSTADFNDDGKLDILFQHDDRRSAVWFMNGTNFNGSILLREGMAPPVGWQIVGTGDFSGRGQTALVWQHRDGRIAVWNFGFEFLETSYIGAALLRNGPAESSGWKIKGVADFDLNGYPDLLWQNANGSLAFWFFFHDIFLGSAVFGHVAPGWQIIGPK